MSFSVSFLKLRYSTCMGSILCTALEGRKGRCGGWCSHLSTAWGAGTTPSDSGRWSAVPGSLKFLTGIAPLLHQGSHAGVLHSIGTRIQPSLAKLFPGAGNKLHFCLLMCGLPQSNLQQLSKSCISQNKMLSLFIAHFLLELMATIKKKHKPTNKKQTAKTHRKCPPQNQP